MAKEPVEAQHSDGRDCALCKLGPVRAARHFARGLRARCIAILIGFAVENGDNLQRRIIAANSADQTNAEGSRGTCAMRRERRETLGAVQPAAAAPDRRSLDVGKEQAVQAGRLPQRAANTAPLVGEPSGARQVHPGPDDARCAPRRCGRVPVDSVVHGVVRSMQPDRRFRTAQPGRPARSRLLVPADLHPAINAQSGRAGVPHGCRPIYIRLKGEGDGVIALRAKPASMGKLEGREGDQSATEHDRLPAIRRRGVQTLKVMGVDWRDRRAQRGPKCQQEGIQKRYLRSNRCGLSSVGGSRRRIRRTIIGTIIAIDKKRGGFYEVLTHDGTYRFGNAHRIQRSKHVLQPRISFCFPDSKPGVTHAEPRMPPLVAVVCRATEILRQEKRQRIDGVGEYRRVHRTKQRICRHSLIEGLREKAKSFYTANLLVNRTLRRLFVCRRCNRNFAHRG